MVLEQGLAWTRTARLTVTVAFLLIALIATSGGRLAAQVTNGDFKSSLIGWAAINGAGWDRTLDAGGSLASGSLEGVFAAAQVTGLYPVATQCVPLAAGASYRVGGKIYVSPGASAPASAYFILVPYPTTDCSGTPPPSGFLQTAPVTAAGAWTASTLTFTNFASSVLLGAYIAPQSGGRFQANFDDVFVELAAVASCAADDHTLCLLGGRFSVKATFDTGAGHPSDAHAEPVGDSGLLWFFDARNIEAVVKMLDGCPLGGHYWFFAGGLTDVAVTITVTDTRTGAVRTYINPLHQAFQPIQDTDAFPCP